MHGALGIRPASHAAGGACLAPGTERLVGYHLVVEGRALVRLEGAANVPLTAGDIVIFPHGDPHTVTNGKPSLLIDSGASIGSLLAGDLGTMRFNEHGLL
jgi:Cupin